MRCETLKRQKKVIEMAQQHLSTSSSQLQVVTTNVITPLRGSVIQSTSYPVESKAFECTTFNQIEIMWHNLYQADVELKN